MEQCGPPVARARPNAAASVLPPAGVGDHGQRTFGRAHQANEADQAAIAAPITSRALMSRQSRTPRGRYSSAQSNASGRSSQNARETLIKYPSRIAAVIACERGMQPSASSTAAIEKANPLAVAVKFAGLLASMLAMLAYTALETSRFICGPIESLGTLSRQRSWRALGITAAEACRLDCPDAVRSRSKAIASREHWLSTRHKKWSIDMVKVPRLEAEVVNAAARRYGGDTEKVPTTALRGVTVRGVTLSSRYSKADELEEMGRVIEIMTDDIAAAIESVFCDSKACADYLVTLRSNEVSERVNSGIRDAFIEGAGGFNGLRVVGPPRQDVADFGAWWPEGDLQ
jgi:hypothetical protein